MDKRKYTVEIPYQTTLYVEVEIETDILPGKPGIEVVMDAAAQIAYDRACEEHTTDGWVIIEDPHQIIIEDERGERVSQGWLPYMFG